MKIGELAEKTGISRSTIRRYDRLGLLEKHEIIEGRGEEGYRRFADDAAPKLRELYESIQADRDRKLREKDFAPDGCECGRKGIVIPLITGLSVNHCYIKTKSGGRALSKAASVWKEMTRIIVKMKFVGTEGDDVIVFDHDAEKNVRVPITVKAFFRDKRSVSDLDNMKKLLADAIKEAIGVDDKYFDFIDESPGFDRECPRLTVRFEMKKES